MLLMRGVSSFKFVNVIIGFYANLCVKMIFVLKNAQKSTEHTFLRKKIFKIATFVFHNN